MSNLNKLQTQQKSNPGFGRVLQSTLAAAFGVQSNKNREKDFENGNMWVFILSGMIFTTFFILTLITLANIAVSGG